MRFHHLNQWLDWFESFDIHRSTEQALIDFKTVADRLGLLPYSQKVMTVAGTNGKGSCVAVLESIYRAAGYTVGAYSSPHLLKFNERIRLQQQNCNDETLCDAFEKIDQMRHNTPLTYFQFSTLAALIIFKENDVDVAILEIGIGGRFDAVNVIDPDVSIIASIGLDHCQMLGTSREEIGWQKAGVMRFGKPVICGDLDVPQSIISEAEKIGAKLFCIQKDFSYQLTEQKWSWTNFNRQYNHLPISSLMLSNIATSLMAIVCFEDELPVNEAAIHQGLQKIYLLGRRQLVQINNRPNIIFDVAHNPDAISQIATMLKTLPIRGKKIAVVGMFQDKDILQNLKPLIKYIDQWCVSSLNHYRGASFQLLQEALKSLGIQEIACYPEPRLAFREAYQNASEKDLIIVFGSFVTVAEIYNNFMEYQDG